MKKLFKTIISASVLLSTTLVLMPVSYGIDANTLPSLSSATNGSTSVSGSRMDVYVEAPQGGLSTYNWNSFNVGSNAQVNYAFQHQNQTALNIVAATGGMSQIYGKITQSTDCPGCDYTGTGKVILLNPNGVYFGNGASVDLNSFTASSFNGVYDKDAKILSLTKGANSGKIVVDKGANIYGDKNIAFVAPNVEIYNGSKLTTNIAPNVGEDSYGKIKLVTADGVNFSYYNNGAIRQVSDVKNSADKMNIFVGGDLTSGNVDMRNMSTHEDSQINLNGAVVKATQAVSGNDGNIYLTANNKVIVDNSTLKTENYSDAVKGNGGTIAISSGKKSSVMDSTLDSVNNVLVASENGDSFVEGSVVKAQNLAAVTSTNESAALQKNSDVTAKDVYVIGGKNAVVHKSTVRANNNVDVTGGKLAKIVGSNIGAGNNINVTSSGDAIVDSSLLTAKNINVKAANSLKDDNFKDSTLTASNDVNLTSTKNSIELTSKTPFKPSNYLNLKAAKDIKLTTKDTLTVDKTSFDAGDDIYLTSTGKDVVVKNTTKFIAADNIYISGKNNVKTSGGNVDLKGIKTTIDAGKDVDVKLAGVDNPEKGLTVKGGNDVTITTPGTLSVSSLVSGHDMTINADKVIAGKPYTTQEYPDKDTNPRSYIEVKGKFTSNTANDKYDTTKSYDPTVVDGKNYYQRHLIQYGNGAEKILLVNNQEYTPAADRDDYDVDAIQALRTIKLPKQAENVNKNAPINDNRTVITDVYAAASSIEIVEDDED